MKKFAMMLLSLLMLTGCAAGPKTAGYQKIDQQKAQSLMETETDYLILDVRTPEEFASGHIPNAINIPVETIGTSPIPQLPQKDQLILVYCRSGNRSKTASQRLADQGYTNIAEFGGINTWPGEIVTD